MNTTVNKRVFNPQKLRFFGFLRIAAVVCLALLAGGCGHMASIYSPADYTLDDLSTDVFEARAEMINGYKGYAGRVVKITPANGVNWNDFSRVAYWEWNIPDTGFYEITVEMSVMVESADSGRLETSAYRPDQRIWGSTSTLQWKGPASLGWTVQGGDALYAQFGGQAVTVPEGKWVDLSFTQPVDITEAQTGQIYIDGHNDHQGLIDQTLYVRHFKVTMKTTSKFIALTFNDSPSDFTDILLDKLDQHEVKASFFVLGAGIDAAHPLFDRNLETNDRLSKAGDRRTTIKRMFDDGHDIGNFLYSHASTIDPSVSEEDLAKDLESTQIAIQKAVYGETEYLNNPWVSKYVRDPFGSGGEISEKLRRVSINAQMPLIGGVQSPGESAEQIADSLYGQVTPWIISVNGDPRSDPSVIRVLDIIIPKLKQEGYIFVTLSEMAQRRQRSLVYGSAYTNFDPETP